MKDQKKLQDILDAIAAIETYAVSSYADFLADAKTQDAILYNLIIIGEAANQISEDFQEQHYQIPWSAMIGTRNIIVPGYDQVKLPIVWEILQRDLASLKAEILKALSTPWSFAEKATLNRLVKGSSPFGVTLEDAQKWAFFLLRLGYSTLG